MDKKTLILHLVAGIEGGAAISGVRIHRALQGAGFNSCLRTRDDVVETVDINVGVLRWERLWDKIRVEFVGRVIARLAGLLTGRRKLFQAVVWSGWYEYACRMKPDCVFIHWASEEMLSMRDIRRIAARWPTFFVCHDMWLATVDEHYVEPASFEDRYTAPKTNAGAGMLETWLFRRKRAALLGLGGIVCPSQWMLSCVRASTVTRQVPAACVAYPIDLQVFSPAPDRPAVRRALGLEEGTPVMLFGAASLTDRRKGGDLMAGIADRCASLLGRPLVVLTFGAGKFPAVENPWLRVVEMGFIQSEVDLVRLYQASDVYVLPTRMDNLPNSAVEAVACGVPVAGFRIGGMSDIVQHGEIGFLAEPFELDALCAGIVEVLERGIEFYAPQCRGHAEATFDPAKIAEDYAGLVSRLVASREN